MGSFRCPLMDPMLFRPRAGDEIAVAANVWHLLNNIHMPDRGCTPGLPSTERSDARSTSSTADAPWSTNGFTAAQAAYMSGKIINDVSRY